MMDGAPFHPPHRTVTGLSYSTSEPSSSDAQPTCRICRSEGTDSEPLFHPCKCSGSIKHVHQDCLMEWLSHSHKKHCELCKTPFRFTKLYDADMPAQLPWEVFVKRALRHVGQGVLSLGRALLVGMVWMVILPWCVRWAWRWMFWMSDAGWARDIFVSRMKKSDLVAKLQEGNATDGLLSSTAQALQQAVGLGNETGHNLVEGLANTIGLDVADSRTFNQTNPPLTIPRADSSIFSSWTYLSELTPNHAANKMILDIFEGQLITCLVIIGFILVFLIREWVVQQQPLVNLDQLNNVQQQLREAADRVQDENDRFRRQQELLDQARRRLLELQRETENAQRESMERLGIDRPKFIGWERLEEVIDSATEKVRKGDQEGFRAQAATVTEQIRAAGFVGASDLDDFTERLYTKLEAYPEAEQKAWEAVLVTDVEAKDKETRTGNDASQSADHGAQGVNGERAASPRRPPMPEREFSSRATQIQRLLEEADGIFKTRGEDANRPDAAASDDAPEASRAPAGEEPRAGTPASADSWQEVTPPNEPSLEKKLAELSDRIPDQPYDVEKEEVPITNAGPDAKVNIKRSGKGKARAVPEPKLEEKIVKESENKSPITEGGESSSAPNAATASPQETSANADQAPQPASNNNNNPLHPDGPAPDQPGDDSLTARVASVFREEFGLDEAEELENLRQMGLAADGETTNEPEETVARRPEEPKTYFGRLLDWFWGDIQVAEGPEAVPAVREERMNNENAAQEAPFVPVQDGQPVPAHAPAPDQPQPQPAEAHQEQQPNADEARDPEVLAAAAQAGLDAEAVEDAEDLEGIFELIGLQGPLAGLFQTSMFCLLLVGCTVYGAVGLPYVFGKFVLSFIADPVLFAFTTPLKTASFIADFVIDTSLFMGGWAVMLAGLAGETFFAALPFLPAGGLVEKMTNAAMKTASASGTRLQWLVTPGETGSPSLNDAFLGASVHSHASLRALQEETNAVLGFIGRGIFASVNTISSGSAETMWQQSVSGLAALPGLLAGSLKILLSYAKPLFTALTSMRGGLLTLTVPSAKPTAIDPSLIFWSPTDRFLAVCTGYGALALIATAYVIADTPITSYHRLERQIRDTLRQAGGVVKVILIISIEMILFPLYCGILLDIAFLPLFENASMATRLAFAATRPWGFGFVHWFVGTCYMFHFALFVGMCRKILRKGVLWFIRDPDDPTFHPVRDVLERNVATQLRKIAFSALVYGALVILCLGGVIWTIGKAFKGIFPICWISTEPVFEFPADLLLYNFLTPLLFRLFKPSDAVNVMYAWWLRRCARVLRLSHFLFDDRRTDEEGHTVHKTWASRLLPGSGTTDNAGTTSDERSLTERPDFKRDGKYVLTPCNDQYRPPKRGEAFLHTDDDDVYIADKDGKKNEQFAKVYVPPLFRWRITAFMVCLWAFSAFTGLCATLVPLAFGRKAIAAFAPGMRVNDIYAYSIGAYTLGGVLFAAMKGAQGYRRLREKAQNMNVRAWLNRVASFAFRTVKCAYVYGFLGLVLPLALALMLQFYLIVPLHTYMVAHAHHERQSSAAANLTQAATNLTTPVLNLTALDSSSSPGPWLADHSIHILSDYALGLLYIRLLMRMVLTAPSSRPAAAFRLITAKGYLNPNSRLFTRYFALPLLFLTAFLLLAPPAGAWALLRSSGALGKEAQTLVYRYSYPVTAGVGLAVWGLGEVWRELGRWRGRIRDEVYLVGERLHNFGERRPPRGVKTMVKRGSAVEGGAGDG